MGSNEPARPKFDILDLQGKEYHRWVSDVENTFIGKRLTNTIKPSGSGTNLLPFNDESKPQALMFLRLHIHRTLKKHYLNKTNIMELWDVLKQRFNNMHDAQLPELTARWKNTRLLEFPKIQDYNQAMLDLQLELSFCGVQKTQQDMIERSLNTFPTSMSILAHQYQIEYKYGKITTFSDLINILAKKERHHEIILNNNSRPAGTKKPKSYQIGGKTCRNKKVSHSEPYAHGGHALRRGRGGRGRGQGHSQNLTWNRDQNANSNKNQAGSVPYGQQSQHSGKYICFKCGSNKYMPKQYRASREIQNIYKRHKQYLTQELNCAGDLEMEVDTNLILAEDKGIELATPDFD